MPNKKTTHSAKKVRIALENLPYNYVKKTLLFLSENENITNEKKTYSARYIQKVKAGEAFNEDIINALTKVGLENYHHQKKFESIRNKKASSA